MDKYNIVQSVDPGSIAEEIGIGPGDVVMSINGRRVRDILEYKYLEAATALEIQYCKPDGQQIEVLVGKDEYEDLGINFQYPLMSVARSCKNKCIFCFIDQLPKGMRSTLYFKDDDSRLSFLQGNYVSLTNMSEEDIASLIEMRVSPINVSVHTTNPQLRLKMLKNPKAVEILDIMRRFAKHHIIMNCQIVLCKGENDGKELERTLKDLEALFPQVNSVSIVPVGLSKYREGLYPLKPFDGEDAAQVIDLVVDYQKRFLSQYGSRIVYLSDEFYLKANRSIPSYDEYEDFPQIENGVGLIASMEDEFIYALEEIESVGVLREVSIATGVSAYEFICSCAQRLMARIPGLQIHVHRIINEFFGEQITVAGLLCGCDLEKQLKGKPLGETLFITSSMLRAEEDVFLDDVRLEELSHRLSVPIVPVQNDGFEFVRAISGIGGNDETDCCDYR